MNHFLFCIMCLFFGNAQSPPPGTASTEVIHLVKASWKDSNTLEMTFKVAPDHKAYNESLFVKSKLNSAVSFKNLKISPLETFTDKFSGEVKQGVHDEFSIVAEVYATDQVKTEAFPLVLGYQACSLEYCLFPQEYTFEIPMFIEDSSLHLRRLMSESWLLALIFVFFAGFLTSFTPCIFPMIPLTLAVLVPRKEQWSFSTKLSRSLSYVLGIAVTYSILGVLAASSGLMFGALLGNKWVALSISLFFVMFSISMLGFFEIKTPSFLSNSKALRSSNTFFYGLAAGVVAGPCVGPVLLSILTYISQTGDVRMGFALMMSFAFGMGLIFILLGTGSGMVKMLPKSGPWLDGIKYVFAGAMALLAMYYAWPVLTLSEFVAFTAFITGAIAGVYLFSYEKKFFKRLTLFSQYFFIVVLVGSCLTAGTALLFKSSIDIKWSGTYYENGWVAYDEKTVGEVLKNGKPTIIDFYADWCLSCKELKKITFADARVIARGEEFNLLLLDATTSSELVEKLKKEHRILGLPTLLFFNAQGIKQEALTLTGFENAESFLTRMTTAQQK